MELLFITIKVGKIPNPFSVLKISAILKSACYDLIHSHASKDLWLLVPALKLFNSSIPLVFTKHIGSYIVKKDFLHNKIYNRVNLALAISSVIKSNLINTTALTADKIEIIHNGVDVEKFSIANADKKRLRKELKISEDEILIGMTGRFSPGKGHEEFLFAANQLGKRFSNLKFISCWRSESRRRRICCKY